MTLRATLARIAAQEDLNFLLTNRIPRRLATRFIGWFSRIENPLVRDASIAIWRLFSDLDLSEARTTRFRSMHDCFIRELKEGARPIDPDPGLLTSPCDAIVGASGPIEGTRVFQVKGFPYGLADLVPDAATVAQVRDGTYVTLRLTSSMYHRFHAPHDCRVESVTHIAGDTWNVNPIALKRVEALFCRNERAVIRTRLAAGGHPLVLVPVAAILVASLRLRFLGTDLDLRAQRPRTLPCDARLAKGEEMGWFQHGSTIIVLAPPGFRLCEGVAEGTRIRMGEPLLRLPDTPA
ncbi:archaetidylserine decarboxylase [Methylobacterium sp. WSM2598]|uniref:archaetidylserine decarboxylase n=1 Tax=Methylobacterium sp. WSM2598 TaxID=398261 RepID=UPI00036E30D2|nr:archaetidylserine decarboxylase [Methylobacterium sp. WSM2598]